MRNRLTLALVAISLLLNCSTTRLDAKETWDLGNVQVVGADAQTTPMTPDAEEISLQMGEKKDSMPVIPVDAMAVPVKAKPRAVTASEAPVLSRFGLGYSRGSRDWEEFHLSALGSMNGYQGSLEVGKDHRNGFKSFVDEDHSLASAKIKYAGVDEESFEMEAAGNLRWDRYSQRGTRAIPTPDAGIEDVGRSLTVGGCSTLPDGGWFNASATIENISRNVANSLITFSEDSTGVSTRVSGEYKTLLRPKVTGKANLGIRRDSCAIERGPEQSSTKRTLGAGAELELNEKTFFELGFKHQGLMDKTRTSPNFRLDHRPSSNWQFVLAWEEDLVNDRLTDYFFAPNYVTYANLNASLKKRQSGRANFRSGDGWNIGCELFLEKEDNALEYFDRYDAGKGMLVYDLGMANDARRTGVLIDGQAKLDDNFTFEVRTIWQDPKDRASGRRLSYEAKRSMDVALKYSSGPLEMAVSRLARYDRRTYLPAEVDPGDYSRADLSCRYSFQKNLKGYVHVKDLYDEAKRERNNVLEEGRITRAGVEFDF